MTNEIPEYVYVSPTCKACFKRREYTDTNAAGIVVTIELTDPQHNTLVFLYKKDGEIASREEILKELSSEYSGDNYVDKLISDIRNKCDKVFIKTVRGRGYKWNPPSTKEKISPTGGQSIALPKIGSRITSQDAAKIIESRLVDFEKSDDDDECARIIRIILRYMDSLEQIQYNELRDYFEQYLDFLQEIGEDDSLKNLLCTFVVLRFLSREYEEKITEFEQRLDKERNADIKSKLLQTIRIDQDTVLDIALEQEIIKHQIREKALSQGRFY